MGDALSFGQLRQRWSGERVWRLTGTNVYRTIMNELGLKAPRQVAVLPARSAASGAR